MNINKVKTAIKVGDFSLRKDRNPNKITIKYLKNIDKKILTDDSARVYLFVVNNIIKKIGGSSCKGGIKATMDFYINAMQGSPGRPRFIIHLLIERELKRGAKVKLYMIRAPKIEASIPGLFGYRKMKITSYKEMEKLCLSDYYSIENKYPDWNFQENHEPYPKDLDEKFLKYHKKRLRKKKH